MKKIVPALVLAIVFAGPASRAQWCVPTTAIPYSANMPGITRVTVGSIDRISLDIENFPNNSYVHTGLSQTFEKEETYPISIQFTIDAGIADHMNLRVWIDLNQDGQLDDPGETLLSVDHVVGAYSGVLAIPTTAMSGDTRMRVTAKMCSHGGHSLPTPCDNPPDPLQYHGEIEDYDVTIVEASAIGEHSGPVSSATVLPMPADGNSDLVITSTSATPLLLELLDMTGRVLVSERRAISPGDQRIPMDMLANAVPGRYLLRLMTESATRELILVVAR